MQPVLLSAASTQSRLAVPARKFSRCLSSIASFLAASAAMAAADFARDAEKAVLVTDDHVAGMDHHAVDRDRAR